MFYTGFIQVLLYSSQPSRPQQDDSKIRTDDEGRGLTYILLIKSFPYNLQNKTHKNILLAWRLPYLCNNLTGTPGPEVIKHCSCSTQLSTKLQLLIKTKIPKIKKLLAFSLSDVVFIMLIIVKMPTIVGILTIMSKINAIDDFLNYCEI